MENFSALLWTQLCRFIGTKEQVYLRREKFLFLEFIQNRHCISRKHNRYLSIASGSHAEGFLLQGSDLDMMFIDCWISVLPPSETRLHRPDLIMKTEHVKPGFARLHVTRASRCLHLYPQPIVKVDNCLYLSSAVFRDSLLQGYRTENQFAFSHGPCITEKDDLNLEIDNLICFHCSEWPEKAREWLHRHRGNDWPSNELVQDIVNSGYLLVPIGNPMSQSSDIEWRISFSKAEKELVHSFNHTQMLCYGLLKLYLKHVIECDVQFKGLLCSYFLKTCLFYCIEEENIEWDKKNFTNCFFNCLKRLIVWVRDGYCPNYFIKENNMFEGKICGDKQVRLTEHLSNLYQNGVDVLVRIPCLSNLNIMPQDLVHPFSNMNLNLDIDPAELEHLVDTEFIGSVPAYYDLMYNYGIVLIGPSESHPMTSPLIKANITLWHSCSSNRLSQFLFYNSVQNTKPNKEQYTYIKKLQNFILHTGIDYDICTGWLQYATMCYSIGQYGTVIRIIESVLKKFRSYVLYYYRGYINEKPNSYIAEICGHGLTVSQKMKLVISRSYGVNSKFCIDPSDIVNEIKLHSHNDVTFIPPVVYANVLLFLSYKALRCSELQQYAMTELYIAAHSKHFVGHTEIPLTLALLNKCLQLHSM